MDEIMGTTAQEDRNAVFERVWQRVMEGRTASAPVPWEGSAPAQPPEETQAHGSLQSESPQAASQEGDSAILPVRPRPDQDRPHSDFPTGHGGF